MDPFTEKLLERTRARRENLQKKMASRPTASSAASGGNKRAREPLADANSVLSDTPLVTTPQPSSKPSPSKRSRSGEITAPPLQPPPPPGGEEENREPPPPVVPAMLSDPRTDRKPPVGPASVRSSSSLEKRSAAARPVVQAAAPPQQEAQAVGPEPERMVEHTAAAPQPQRREEPQRGERCPAPREPEGHMTAPPPAGRTQVQPRDREAPPPAAASMKSRLQRLADRQQCWDGNGDDADAAPGAPPPPSPLKRREEEAVVVPTPASSSSSSSSSAPTGRRGRLANLAATIGSWEDDLSHHPAPSRQQQQQQDNEQGKPGTAWAAKMAARDAAAKQQQQPAGAAASASKQPPADQTPAAKWPAAQRVLAGQPASSSKPPASSNQPTVADSPAKAGRVVLPGAQQQQQATAAPRGPGTTHSESGGQASPQKKASNQGPAYLAASPQKASANQGVSYPASPQKAGPSSSSSSSSASSRVVISQSPRKDRGLDFNFSGSSSKKPEPGTNKPPTAAAAGPSSAPQSRDHHQPSGTPLQQKATAGPTGVKSFVERFGERCQERSNHSSPAAAGSAQAAARTPASSVTPSSSSSSSSSSSVSPSTRLVQDRLRAAQSASTATADLTQRQKLERESELAQIRGRFQKGSGNMWKNKEDETEPPAPKKHPEITVVETVSCEPDCSQSVDEDGFSTASSLTCATDPFSTASNYTSAGHLLAVSPPTATSSPLRRPDLVVEAEEKPSSSSSSSSEEVEKKNPSSSSSEEVEMSVDQSITSAVINGLFEGVYDEEEDDDEEEEEDALNISSMSLLAPLEETVAAVVRSPERRLMTSTPAGSFNDKSETPDSKPSKFQRARVTRGGSADGIDEKLPYSVDAYRSIKKKDVERPDVKQVIVRKEDVTRRLDQPRATSAASIKQRMKMLSDEMNLQQTIIHQASQALNCCTDQEHGKGSQVEAEAERLLLVATERRAAVKTELEKLKGQGSSSAATQNQQGAASGRSSASRAQEEMGASPSKGSISLGELRLPLKADFACSAGDNPESADHYFFLMIRAGAENTVATPLASPRNALSGDALAFTTKFAMSDVCSDFEIDIEVYYLQQKREQNTDKRKKPSKSKAMTPKRFLAITKASQTPVLASPGGPNSVRSSNFSLVGSHKLTLASIGKNKFPLTKVPFRCPMEGHICLKLQCQVGCTVEERGFLTMFEDVSGFGAWHRRWCVLSGYCISYWTYPDDERRKKPMGRINLANCTSRKVEPANREFCARPNTFELVTVRPQRDEDKETLVSQCKNTMCVTKNWLCADTKDERNLWMLKLNQILVDLRMWQPDSCYRPQ